MESLDEAGLLLGICPEELFSDREFRFESGDRLLLYSDGLTEAENVDEVSFGDGRLAPFMTESQSLGVEMCASNLLREVLHWSAQDEEPAQKDDIIFVIVDFL